MAATANHWRILSNFDLVIFDEAEVRDRASYENPHRYAAGICRQGSIALGIHGSGSRNGGGGNRTRLLFPSHISSFALTLYYAKK